MPGSSLLGGPIMGQPTTTSPVMAQPVSPAIPANPASVPNSGEASNATKSSTAAAKKNNRNGYRAKELAEIRNSLRPFEQADSMVAGLRTVSSLSTESSTNSVCSTDGFTTSSSSNNNMA